MMITVLLKDQDFLDVVGVDVNSSAFNFRLINLI